MKRADAGGCGHLNTPAAARRWQVGENIARSAQRELQDGMKNKERNEGWAIKKWKRQQKSVENNNNNDINNIASS